VVVLGIVLVLAGCALALRSGMLLAGRGRPRRGPKPALVIAGPYRRVRNPLLGGMLLALVGAALARQSTALLVATAMAAVAAHAWLVRVEEPRLRARLGPAYEAYLVCVPRWFPRSRAEDDRDVDAAP
jgi:protein-S-isoprenylcysteine O-methyltransferase Ste14